MRNTSFLLLAVLVCAALAAAGCVAGPASSPAVSPAPAVSLPSLALDRQDLPEGYVLTMYREKNESDVGTLALDLGWQGGYVEEYTDSTGPAGSQVVIRHSLATYPATSMPAVMGYVTKVDQACNELRYFDIAVDGLGPDARGFVGYVPGADVSPVTTTGTAVAGPLLLMGTGDGQSGGEACGQHFIEIVFAKGTTLEVIRVTGTVDSDKDIIAIARKAYAKIP
jgi:hypothetical protein